MFANFKDSTSPTLENFDVCIIGAGAAGITTALQLSDAGLRVLLIESGGFELDGDTQSLYDGTISGLDYFDLAGTRLRFFGGTTNHWSGQSCRLEPIDFRVRPWVAGSGWPVAYDDYLSWLPKAVETCRLAFANQFPTDIGPLWETHSEDAVPDFPLADTDFVPVILRFPVRPFSFGAVYRKSVERSERLLCLLGGNVTRLETDPASGTVQRVHIASLDGKTAVARASRYVLATGAIENARLLLASGPGTKLGEGPGIGNRRDLVGRYFMEHPNHDASLVSIDEEAGYLHTPKRRALPNMMRLDFRLKPEVQEKLEILNHSAFLRPHFSQDLVEKIWNKVVVHSLGLASQDMTLRVRLEQAPRAQNRITLTEETDSLGLPMPHLHLEMGEIETKTVAAVHESFARALGMTSAGRMRVDFDATNESWMSQVDYQYHHLGGTRMASTPATGVVDPDCRVFESPNLFIAGSSIFPTGGHANPTMNLLAFAHRMADQIRRELKP